MRSKINHVIFSTLLVAASAFYAINASAQIREQNIKFTFVQPIDSHMGLGAQKFAELVSEKSGKKMIVKLYPNGTLGGDLQALSFLQGGTIEMTTLPPGLMVGLNKEYAVFDMPFLFNNFSEADAVLDGKFGKAMLDKSPNGLVGIAYWDHGFRNLSNSKKPVSKLEDMQGMKIRVSQSPMIIGLINGLGANAVPMSFTELYSALENKAVDGQENPNAVFESNKFYEVQKYLSLTRHQYNPLILLFSAKGWAQLNADEKKVIIDAANEARPYQRKVSREMDTKSLEKIKAEGVTVTDISPQERKQMQDKLIPVSQKLAKEVGENLVNDINAELKKIRAAVK